MTKRKPKQLTSLGKASAFTLVVVPLPSGEHILGVRDASFATFRSAADVATYLRQTADAIEFAWAQRVKERANLTTQ